MLKSNQKSFKSSCLMTASYASYVKRDRLLAQINALEIRKNELRSLMYSYVNANIDKFIECKSVLNMITNSMYYSLNLEIVKICEELKTVKINLASVQADLDNSEKIIMLEYFEKNKKLVYFYEDAMVHCYRVCQDNDDQNVTEYKYLLTCVLDTFMFVRNAAISLNSNIVNDCYCVDYCNELSFKL